MSMLLAGPMMSAQEQLVITSLADLFTTQDGFAYEFDDLSTLWQDTSATTAVTTNGDPIARVDDVSGNGYNATQSTSSFRPTYNDSSGIRWAGFNTDFLTIPSSTASLKWIHADNGFGLAALVRFGNVADPNAIYGLLGNTGGSSSNIGISLFWDDRASSSRNENGLFRISNGSGTYLYENIPGNGTIPANSDVNLGWNIPSGGTSDIYVENSLISTDAKTGSASSSNATFSLDIGALGNATGSSALVGRIYQIIIRDEPFSSIERSALETYFASKL